MTKILLILAAAIITALSATTTDDIDDTQNTRLADLRFSQEQLDCIAIARKLSQSLCCEVFIYGPSPDWSLVGFCVETPQGIGVLDSDKELNGKKSEETERDLKDCPPHWQLLYSLKIT
jgi:hypothetical protein